jgi:hypothetical protein
MRLKINRLLVAKKVEEEKAKVSKAKESLKKYPDEYKEEFPPDEVILSDSNKLVLTIRRGGEFGLPEVDIRHFIKTEVYTGFTKRGIHFDLEKLQELIDVATKVHEKCRVRKLTPRDDEEG